MLLVRTVPAIMSNALDAIGTDVDGPSILTPPVPGIVFGLGHVVNQRVVHY